MLARASDVCRGRLVAQLDEMLNFNPGDLDHVAAEQLHPVTADPETTHLMGQLWGASKTLGGGAAFADRPGSSPFVTS